MEFFNYFSRRGSAFIPLLLFLMLFSLQIDSAEEKGSKVPKIGLALSGGGAKGLAHLGVLKVLEEEGIPIDMISGTSMGAVVGGFYAVGWSAKELIDHFLSLNFSELFVDQPRREEVSLDRKDRFQRYVLSLPLSKRKIKLPSGLVEGQKLSVFCSKLTWPALGEKNFLNLPIPIVILATDLASGEPVAITSGILPDAIRASMSIPSVFYPVNMGSRRLVDGMLVRNFPVEDVQNLGADLVIGVDVGTGLLEGSNLQSMLEIVDQAISFRSSQDNDRQRSLSDILILPDLDGLSRSEFSQVRNWIERGESATRKILPEIKERLSKLGIPLGKKPLNAIKNQPVYLEKVLLKGLKKVPQAWVLRELNLSLPGFFTQEALATAVERLYRSLFFRTVSYSLDGTTLIVDAVERESGHINLGIRYDSAYRTQVLINSTLSYIGKFHSRTLFDVVLGNENRVELENFFLYQTAISHYTGLRTRTFYEEDEPYVFAVKSAVPVGPLPLKRIGTELLLGSVLDNNHGSGIGLRAEKNWIDEEPFFLAQQKQQKLFEVFAVLMVDSLNNSYFPTRGTFLQAQIELADKELNSDADYLRKTLIYERYLSLGAKNSLILGTKHGHLKGDLVPFYRKFSLGGFGNFREEASLPGFRKHALGGNYLQGFRFGLEHLRSEKLSFGLNLYAGLAATDSKFLFEFKDMLKSTVLSIKKKTRLGPAQAHIAYNSDDHFLTHLSLGYQF
jgi:NTE family protein